MTLFVSDLDGTLLNDRSTVDPPAAAVLRSMCASGLLFTAASGRIPHMIRSALAGTGIELTAPAVCQNGAALWDMRSDRPVRTYEINDGLPELMDVIYSFPYSLRLHTVGRGLDVGVRADCPPDRYCEAFLGAMKALGVTVYPFSKGFIPKRLVSGSYFGPTDELRPVYRELAKLPSIRAVLYPSTHMPECSFLEFNSESGGKGRAARDAAELVGADELVAFGDNYNDLPLFDAADRCFAPANAEPAVRRRADKVLADNNSGAVVYEIERLRSGFSPICGA